MKKRIYFRLKFFNDQNTSSLNFTPLTTAQSFKNSLNNQNKHFKIMTIQAFAFFKINHVILYIKTDR